MTEETLDVVEAVRQLRAMGAVKVSYRGCDVVFDSLPMRAAKPEDAQAEYERIALASAG